MSLSKVKVSALIVPALGLVVFGLMTWPVWQWLWGEWWGNDYYTHGVLIVPLALYLAVRRVPQWHSLTEQGDNRGLILLGLSVGLFLVFLLNNAFFLAAFMLIGLGSGTVWTFAGLAMLRRLAFPIGFLALMVPLPFIDLITLPLALFTGVCSGSLVNWLGLDVLIRGTAVTLPNTNLVIGAQCSGINSIMALSTLTVLVAYVVNGPWWGRLLLVALSIPLAMLGNILRVASLLFVAYQFDVQAAFTFYHDYSGIVAFILIFALMLPLSRALRCGTLRYEVL